jgi:Flp pilus assembly pilin Flp
MRDSIIRLLWDEAGQDTIEYALLSAAIGVIGVATWPAIAAAVGNVYQILDGDTQDLWEMPNPAGP